MLTGLQYCMRSMMSGESVVLAKKRAWPVLTARRYVEWFAAFWGLRRVEVLGAVNCKRVSVRLTAER